MHAHNHHHAKHYGQLPSKANHKHRNDKHHQHKHRDTEGHDHKHKRSHRKMKIAAIVLILVVVAAAIAAVIGTSTASSSDVTNGNDRSGTAPPTSESSSDGSTSDGSSADDYNTGQGETPDDEDTDDSYVTGGEYDAEAVIPTPVPTRATSPTHKPTAFPTTTPAPTTKGSLGRDPAPPVDKLATADQAFDPFTGAPETFNKGGVFYNWTRANLVDIGPASPLLGGLAPLGKMIPGRVIKNGKPLIEYWPGNSPFLLFCIHTETNPWSKYMDQWPLSRRGCDSGSCRDDVVAKNWQTMAESLFEKLSDNDVQDKLLEGTRGGRKGPKTDKDVDLVHGDASGPMCRSIYQYVIDKTGGAMHPHMIYTQIPKVFIDFNRHPGHTHWLLPRGQMRQKYKLAAQSPELVASYDDGLGFVREAKNIIARQYGYGWSFNMHSQGSVGNRCDIGTGLEGEIQKIFKNPDIPLNKIHTHGDLFGSKGKHWSMSMLFDSYARNISVYDSLFGKSSIAEIISRRGVGTAPSLAFQYKHGGEGCFCSGSSFTNRFGSPNLATAQGRNQRMDNKEIEGRPVEDWYVGNWNAAIVEFYGSTVDPTSEQGKKISEVWGETLIDIAIDHWKLPVERSGSRIYKSLDTTIDYIHGGMACKKGKKSKQLAKDTAEKRAIYTANECIARCKEIDGCKWISMYVHNENKRACTFYSTCQLVQTRWYNTIEVEPYLANQ